MKVITKYVANDGREFFDVEECKSYEENTQAILAKVKKLKNNPSEALVTLMIEIQNVLGISLVSYGGYVKLFRNHQPCAYACSLWRMLSDYSHDYPTIFSMYSELMDEYIALYGEPK